MNVVGVLTGKGADMKLNPRKRAVLAIAGAALVATGLSGCGGASSAASPTEVANEMLELPPIDDTDGLVIDGERVASADLLAAARREGSVAWYTGSGAESAELTAARFEAETGVAVDVTRLPSGKLSERVLSEAGAGRLGAGVVLVTDPAIAQEMAASDVFSRYEVPGFDDVADMDGVVWDNGLYYTPYYSAYAFAYNSAALDELDIEPPATWDDLLDDTWQNRLGIVSAGAGGTVQGLAQFQEEQLGDYYWQGLEDQNPRIFDTTSPQLEALARGEILVATSGFNSTYGAEESGSPLRLVVPEKGVSGTYNMQGLTTTGADSPAAKLFMNWTMSTSGQRFAAAQGFVGARTDVEQVPTGDYQLPAADDPSFVIYTPEDASKYGADIVARWNKTFGY